ncbi:MAG: type II toxin-antitoxin system RelE/ParE family toxin [Bdellovibrionales bacterium]|nr:type II toxin-antitoxin system RelE/ParE family toxin [Bdellovibrionales bacterium]
MSLESKPREAIYYQTVRGLEPVYDYLKKMKDKIGQAKIRAKISKAERGNFGQEGTGYRHISGDIWELKIRYGPGYRLYFALDNDELIVLLFIGDKKSQDSDISKAQKYLDDYKERS